MRTRTLLIAAVALACGLGAVAAVVRTVPAEATDEGLRFTVAGDSLTAGNGDAFPGSDDVPQLAWPRWADAEPDLVYAGGWAVSGATSTEIAAGVTARDAEVLVILAGTNDFRDRVPLEREKRDLVAIANTVGAPGVVLLALPPLDRLAGEGVVADWNVELEAWAAEQGWSWVDPWRDHVAEGGAGYAWADGASPDGIHPDLRVQEEVAAVVADAIRDTAAGLRTG